MLNELSSKQALPLDGLRVLLVEDESDARELFTFVFEQAGAEVMSATLAKEALDILENYEADILISNIKLPDADGCWLIGEVKERQGRRDRKIVGIAVTGLVDDDDRIRILKSGFQKHLSKPVEPDRLVEVLAKLTGRDKPG